VLIVGLFVHGELRSCKLSLSARANRATKLPLIFPSDIHTRSETFNLRHLSSVHELQPLTVDLCDSRNLDTTNQSTNQPINQRSQSQPRVSHNRCTVWSSHSSPDMSSQPLLQSTPGTLLTALNCHTRQPKSPIDVWLTLDFQQASESPSQPVSSPKSSSRTKEPSYHG
jgi:hypothetical protein